MGVNSPTWYSPVLECQGDDIINNLSLCLTTSVLGQELHTLLIRWTP